MVFSKKVSIIVACILSFIFILICGKVIGKALFYLLN